MPAHRSDVLWHAGVATSKRNFFASLGMKTVRLNAGQDASVKNILKILVVLLLFIAVRGYADDFSETDKINYLIASVEGLQGATFIRNGSEHDARTASSHLRRKLKAMGDKVKTAEDFISLCASKSSMTGKPYLIRLADGSIIKSELFFNDKLKALAAKNYKHKDSSALFIGIWA